MEFVGEKPISITKEARLWWRCGSNTFTQEELRQVRHAFALGTMRQITVLLPSEIYNYTKIFTTAIICWVLQCLHKKEAIREWNSHTNEAIIAQAMHSFSRTYYSVGWIKPKQGLLLNSVARLCHKAISGMNYTQQKTIGFKDVERDGVFAVDMHAFRCATQAKIMRVYYAAEASIFGLFLWVAEVGKERVASRERWMAAIKPASKIVRNQLTIPIHEIAMFSPNLGHKGLLTMAKGIQWSILTGKDTYFIFADLKKLVTR